MTMCSHSGAVPVESIATGELLAALCPDCDQQLSAEFLTCPHDNVIEISELGERPGRGICNGCGTSAWFDRPRPVLMLDADVSAEDLAELAARFKAAQRKHRVMLLPHAARQSAPTPDEIL